MCQVTCMTCVSCLWHQGSLWVMKIILTRKEEVLAPCPVGFSISSYSWGEWQHFVLVRAFPAKPGVDSVALIFINHVNFFSAERAWYVKQAGCARLRAQFWTSKYSHETAEHTPPGNLVLTANFHSLHNTQAWMDTHTCLPTHKHFTCSHRYIVWTEV